MRLVLAALLVVTLVAVSATADAAAEPGPPGSPGRPTTTSTTTPSTTTTIPDDSDPSSTTTTTVGSLTTTAPSATTTTPSGSTTTDPSATSTTVPSETVIEEPDPSPEGPDFRVGTRRPPSIFFPVIGPHTFSDTFGAPRDGGLRRHAGIDIFAKKGVPVVAVADGVIEAVAQGRKAGQYVIVRHDDGWQSKYLHFDNDTPGTDDGRALGYAKDIEVGMRVKAGAVLGFVGDSGNAERTLPHLHFELHQPGGLPVNPYRALVGAADAVPSYTSNDVHSFDTTLVGHLDVDRSGFNTDVALIDEHVLMGTGGQGTICPGTGVRVIDVSDPSEPVRVAAFAGENEFPGTANTDIWVGGVATPDFEGEIAVVGLRPCDDRATARLSGPFAGFAIYDIVDPADPVLLSAVHTGDGTRGVGSLDIHARGEQLLAAVTVPGSYHDNPEGLGDVRIYDLTNLEEVPLLSDWDLRRDGPLILVEALIARAGPDLLSAHGVAWTGPRQVVVASSAAGMVALDVSTTSQPAFVGSTATRDTYNLLFGSVETSLANAQAGWLFGNSLLVQNDQPLTALPGHGPEEWGRQTLYDFSTPTTPRPVSTFRTENSRSDASGAIRLDGLYSPQRSMPFHDNLHVITWLSDGVRIVDMSKGSRPTEVGFFVPIPRPDPYGQWVSPDGTREMAMAWDAATDGDVVYFSDLNSGLWIFRMTPPQIVERPYLPE